MNDIVTKIKRLFKDRVFYTFVLAFILIVFLGSSQLPIVKGMYPNEYWARKADWHHCADIVLAGDSRVMFGLSPKQMQKDMPDYKILNYGFGGAWFSTQYMDKVETILYPDSDKKIIVAGITPHSLTKRKTGTGNFFETITMSETDKFFNNHFAKLAYFFEPLSFKDAIKQMNVSKEEMDNKEVYYPDGWLCGNKKPGRIDKELKKYIGFYQERLVDPYNVENVIQYVEKWIKQGISVYGFLPPSCKEMYDLENEISGIEEPELVRKFKSAGGIWIETDPAGYVSFDGTHLYKDSALDLSKLIAQKILKYEQNK